MIIPRKIYKVTFGEIFRGDDLVDRSFTVAAETAERAIEVARDCYKNNPRKKSCYVREVELLVANLDAD